MQATKPMEPQQPTLVTQALTEFKADSKTNPFEARIKALIQSKSSNPNRPARILSSDHSIIYRLSACSHSPKLRKPKARAEQTRIQTKNVKRQK
jgi:hypothetical protein